MIISPGRVCDHHHHNGEAKMAKELAYKYETDSSCVFVYYPDENCTLASLLDLADKEN